MIITTTANIEGKSIASYLGTVYGTDIYLVGGLIGGGFANQENLFGNAMSTALSHLEQRARSMGAHAVIGLQTSFTAPGGANSMILALTGTAVTLRDAKLAGTDMGESMADKYKRAEEMMLAENYYTAEEIFYQLGSFRDAQEKAVAARIAGEEADKKQQEAEKKLNEEIEARNAARKAAAEKNRKDNWVCPSCGKENIWFISQCSCGAGKE